MANDIISMNAGEIVLYQPDENIKLEVRINNDTVWLSQAQMGQLFGTNRQAITKHIKNIYETGELNREVTSSILELVQIEGKRKVRRKVEFYNLDTIISVGFRVNTRQGILFRTWANKILKQYLLQGYSFNRQLIALQQHVDDRLLRIEDRLQQNEEQVAFLVKTHQQPTYQLYNNGCVFDAWTYISSLIREATNRIILIDNYVDDRVLAIMQKRQDNVSCTIHTRYTEQFQTDLKKHNEQYPPISYVQLPHRKHDRYLIIDNTVYMLGDSLKNMGASLTAIIRTEMTPEEILAKLD